MNRNDALRLLKEHIKKETLIKHCLAVEAIMREVANELEEDSNQWALLGLLHDIDFEEIGTDYKKHGIVGVEILGDRVDDEIKKAIKSHNYENTGFNPESKIELALIAADAISGLIIACALMMPSKKIADVTVESIDKKFKKKEFARNCNREHILYCEKIGIERIKFYEISLKSLQSIANELGL